MTDADRRIVRQALSAYRQNLLRHQSTADRDGEADVPAPTPDQVEAVLTAAVSEPTWGRPDTSAWPEVWPVACLSTGVVTSDVIAELETDASDCSGVVARLPRVISYPEGFWVYVPEPAALAGEIGLANPAYGPTLPALIRRASAAGIAWLRLDADGPDLPPGFLAAYPDPPAPEPEDVGS